ncbi:MAG: aminoacyl-tRNA hydrolase [Candidatus Fermentibacterota bacterium]
MGTPRLVACLGNPGLRYSLTRHNAGFWAGDVLARRHGLSWDDAGLFSVAHLSRETLLMKPLNFMNRSGRSVSALMDSQGIEPAEILVVSDDVNLELGRLRLKTSGSHGGHNGLRSVIRQLGTSDFPRLRMGVGPPPPVADLAEFVLERLPRELEEEAAIMAHRAADCVESILESGYNTAQTEYNRWDAGDAPL